MCTGVTQTNLLVGLASRAAGAVHVQQKWTYFKIAFDTISGAHAVGSACHHCHWSSLAKAIPLDLHQHDVLLRWGCRTYGCS